MTSDYGYLGTGNRTLSSTFTQSLHARCREAGCQLPQAIELLRIAQEMTSKTQQPTKGRKMPVSAYIGCETKLDGGEHGFLAKRGYVRMSLEVMDPHKDEDEPSVSEERIFCLRHAAAMGLYVSEAHKPAGEIENGERMTVDPEEYERYQQWLEKQL